MKHKIDEIICYIKNNVFNEQLKIEDIASTFGYDKHYFSREFKKQTGYALSEYISSLKSEKAIDLLEQDMNIISIQQQVGYESSGSFTNTFKKYTGSSPIQYKKEMNDLYTQTKIFENGKKDAIRYHDKHGHYSCVVDVEVPLEQSVGLIFIGLFTTPIPNHKPISGLATKSLHGNVLKKIPTGSYYLLVCALNKDGNILSYFNLKNSLRGRVEEKITFPNDIQSFTVHLREAIPEDPPILVNVAKLLISSIKKDNV